jgi:hypothetical protein
MEDADHSKTFTVLSVYLHAADAEMYEESTSWSAKALASPLSRVRVASFCTRSSNGTFTIVVEFSEPLRKSSNCIRHWLAGFEAG